MSCNLNRYSFTLALAIHNGAYLDVNYKCRACELFPAQHPNEADIGGVDLTLSPRPTAENSPCNLHCNSFTSEFALPNGAYLDGNYKCRACNLFPAQHPNDNGGVGNSNLHQPNSVPLVLRRSEKIGINIRLNIDLLGVKTKLAKMMYETKIRGTMQRIYDEEGNIFYTDICAKGNTNRITKFVQKIRDEWINNYGITTEFIPLTDGRLTWNQNFVAQVIETGDHHRVATSTKASSSGGHGRYWRNLGDFQETSSDIGSLTSSMSSFFNNLGISLDVRSFTQAALDSFRASFGLQTGQGNRIKYTYEGSSPLLIRVPPYASNWDFIEQHHRGMGPVSQVLLLSRNDDEEGIIVKNPAHLNDGDCVFIQFASNA